MDAHNIIILHRKRLPIEQYTLGQDSNPCNNFFKYLNRRLNRKVQKKYQKLSWFVNFC